MSIQLNILAFVLGACFLQQQAVLPDRVWMWGLLPIILLTVWLYWRYQTVVLVVTGRILLFVFFLGVGFFWAAIFAHLRLDDALPQAWEGRDIQLVGIVASLPQASDRSVRFQFDVEQVLTAGAVVPKRISLSWYQERKAQARDRVWSPINAGERWQITVRLKRPHSNVNPHGFDYEAWALERNIRAVGYVRQAEDNLRRDQMVNRPIYWIEHSRQKIQQRFSRILSDHAYAGVLITLATGDQRAIPRDQWQIFTRTGTNHLMAISGLHITMVSSIVFAIIYWLWRWSPSLVLRIPARRAAVIAGLIVALGYTLLSGFAIPAQRAFCMLAVVAIALWRGRFTSATMVLAWALLLVVMLDPWATLSPGFWLSFGAIAIIMLVTVGRIGRMHWLTGWLRVQWAITLGLIPLLLAMFQQMSLVSPIANAITIPLVSLAVVPLTLLATLPFFDFLLPLAHGVLSSGMALLQWLSDTPQSVWQQHAPPAWTVAVAIIGIAWMLLPGSLGLGFFSGFPARWLGVVAMLPMFLVLPPRPATGELWLTVLDVGQGLAVVARTEHHALLFDTGPDFGATDSGHRIIVPFLRGEGIRQLDALIVSHADSDHSGGALSVLDAVPVSWLISTMNDDHPIQQTPVNKRQCLAGESWQWDGVHFELLHPLRESYENPGRDTNASSCVLKITTDHGSVLLPADIGKQSEYALLSRAGDTLSSTVLIAPHHGSNTSSTAAFIHQVNPELTIFTVGYRNRYGHPREEVMERYRISGSEWLRSDADGAILLRFAAGGLSIDAWRKSHRRYWQRNDLF
ncbi:MAG: DNA internalization-related competence protein ComEC/Rec2 [Nitrosomonas sp.]|nr:DNA internalization-related competence protein ComEC/Rec2 [Nitrosomonas sp.]MDP1950204.1 DNA internalization-related competence protein ComEC/Rec2 [Nitrosomonas sp.]